MSGSAFRRLIGKIRTASQLPVAVILWLPLAWCLLGLSRAAIRTGSFRRIAPLLGVALGPAAWLPLADTRQEQRASRVGQAIKIAVSYCPWQANCFPQAITARVLLGLARVPYSLCLGVTKADEGPDGFKGHAWVRAGRVSVTGGESFSQYRVMVCYVSVASLPKQY